MFCFVSQVFVLLLPCYLATQLQHRKNSSQIPNTHELFAKGKPRAGERTLVDLLIAKNLCFFFEENDKLKNCSSNCVNRFVYECLMRCQEVYLKILNNIHETGILFNESDKFFVFVKHFIV